MKESEAHTHYGDLPYIIKMIRPAIVFIGWVIMLAIFDHYQLSRFKWLSIGLIVVVTFIFSAMIFYYDGVALTHQDSFK